MTFYEREDLDKLKTQVSLSDYLAHCGVSLTSAGRHLRANCPLHDDSTPSFYVKDDNSYHCYGCQKSGDVFTLTQELYGITFSEAVARVQEYAGGGHVPSVQIAPSTSSESTRLRASDHLLLERVVTRYHQQIKQDSIAQSHLASRKISAEIAEKFEVGSAFGFLSKAFPANKGRMLELGLVSQKGTDAFYRRLTIPVRDSAQQVTQIYGRSFGQKYKHRYLSLPHSSLFHPDALSEPKIILCESILDALTFHSHGFDNAVAVYSAGGLKPDFVAQIADSSVRKVMIAYDADKAGDEGALKAAESLRSHGILSYRLCLPSNMDVNGVAVESSEPAGALERLLSGSRNSRI